MNADSRVVAVVQATAIDPPMSVVALKERAAQVRELISGMMVEGVHYGQTPGTKGLSLLKEGSELLLSAFQIAIEPEIDCKAEEDRVVYTVKARGLHMGTGICVGVGIGRCSTNEEKYKWRKAVCDQEFEQTPESRRRLKWGQGERGTYSVRQVRTNPEDLAPTVLKMAKKRAQADLCLTSLAASSAFKRQGAPPKDPPPPANPQAQTRAAPAASAAATRSTPPVDNSVNNQRPRLASVAQIGLVKRKLDQAGLAETHFLSEHKLADFGDLRADQVDHALAWIATLQEGPPDVDSH